MLTTLAQVSAYLGLSDGVDENRVLDAIDAAESQMERLARRWFVPRQADVRHSVPPHQPDTLILRRDLLDLQAIFCDDGTSVPLSSVAVVDAAFLRLTDGQTFTWAQTPQDAITVTGLWAWNEPSHSAWQTRSAVVDNPLLSGAAQINVADSSVFSAGEMLRIGAELLRVTGIISATAVSVARGVKGTSAVNHAASTPIAVYHPPEDLAHLATRWAAWLYRLPDYADGELPTPELLAALMPFRRHSVLDA